MFKSHKIGELMRHGGTYNCARKDSGASRNPTNCTQPSGVIKSNSTLRVLATNIRKSSASIKDICKCKRRTKDLRIRHPAFHHNPVNLQSSAVVVNWPLTFLRGRRYGSDPFAHRSSTVVTAQSKPASCTSLTCSAVKSVVRPLG